MLSERLISFAVREASKNYLKLNPTTDVMVPPPDAGKDYMLYMHVPFCERLCPYCSFNRFPFSEGRAVPYFKSMKKEMLMLKDLGYDFSSLYIGGGTPTVMIDELCDLIDTARDTFHIKEVSSETNPNHLTPAYLDKLQGRVQRLSVGVQSFDDGLLKQMDRYDKYGSAAEILERIQGAVPYFTSMNVDMIFNWPAQTTEMLVNDVERIIESGATQTTFYPLMASPAVEAQMAKTVGKVDYNRERAMYELVDELLTGGKHPLFTHSSAWTFNRYDYDAGQVASAGFSNKERRCEAGFRRSAGRPDDRRICGELRGVSGHRVGRYHLFGQQPVREHLLRQRVQRSHFPRSHVHCGKDDLQRPRPHAVSVPDAVVRFATGQEAVGERLRLLG